VGALSLRELAAIGLLALAGGLGALALREAAAWAPAARRWLSDAVRPLARAGREGYAPSLAERRRLGLLAAAALLFVGIWFLGPAPAAPLAAAGPGAASWALAARARRYRRSVERQLPAIATAAADALAAGRSVRAALAAARGTVSGPAAAELARVSADLELGRSLEEALGGLRERLGSPRADAFCAALLSQRIAGGDLVALLRRFAAAASERDRIAADARAATAQARFTGALVVALPAGAGLVAELLQPGFLRGLLAEGAALALLGLAAAFQLAGFISIQRLARVGET
jgi:tight adherence protein B